MTVHHQLAKISQEQAGQMKTIVEKLMNKLEEAVISGQLLTDYEMGLISEKIAD